MARHCDAIANKVTLNFDYITLNKYVTAEENAFIVFNSFLIPKKNVILASNIVIFKIVIWIASSPSGSGFYLMR